MMDEAKNIYIALVRLLRLSEDKIVTRDDIDEACNSFEIYTFKDEVTAICEKLMIVARTGTVSYFSEPDVA